MTLGEILNKVDPSYKVKVEDACKRWRVKVRTKLSDLMKLKLNEVNTKLNIEDAYPKGIEKKEIPHEEYQKYLLYQNRKLLLGLKENLSVLQDKLPFFEKILLRNNPSPIYAHQKTVQLTEEIVHILLRNTPEHDNLIRLMLKIDPSIMGSYRGTKRGGEIQIYWAVLGLFSRQLDKDIEDLTVTVLAHEYAHAYSLHGTDANNLKWDLERFFRADILVKESIAQYFTSKLVQDKYISSNKKLKTAFYTLLFHQPKMYIAFEDWENVSPEAVRFAIMHGRRLHDRKLDYDTFHKYIREGKQRMDKGWQERALDMVDDGANTLFDR